MKLRILAATLATGVVTTAAWPLLTGEAEAAPRSEAITVIQHNLDQNPKALVKVLDEAKSSGAQAITLQEVCKNWLPQLRDDHKKWTIHSKVSKAERAAGCGKGVAVVDVAIWTGGSDGRTSAEPLPKDGGFTFKKELDDGTTKDVYVPERTPHLVCVSFKAKSVKQHVCSAHLVAYEDPTKPKRAAQTAKIAQLTKGWIDDGDSVIVGGDFNTRPGSAEVNSLYTEGEDADGGKATGSFHESDQLERSNAARPDGPSSYTTKDRGKIDYLFFSENRTALSSGGRTEIKGTPSGHHMLVAHAKVSTNELPTSQRYGAGGGPSGEPTGTGALFAVQRDDAGTTALHTLKQGSGFQTFATQTKVLDHATTGSLWDYAMADFNADGVDDLYAINRNDGGQTAVHVRDGKSGYQLFALQVKTGLHNTDNAIWELDVADQNGDGRADLFAINRNDQGRTAVHVLDAASNFQNFTVHTLSGLHNTDNPIWDLEVADHNADGRADLYAMNRNDQGRTAVHVLDGATGFQNFTVHTLSGLHNTDNPIWDLDVADHNRDGHADLYAINRNDQGRTAVHVLDAATGFQNFTVHTLSGLHNTDNPSWEVGAAG